MRRRGGMWTLASATRASATRPPFRPRLRNVQESGGGKQQRCEDQNRVRSHAGSLSYNGNNHQRLAERPVPEIEYRQARYLFLAELRIQRQSLNREMARYLCRFQAFARGFVPVQL